MSKSKKIKQPEEFKNLIAYKKNMNALYVKELEERLKNARVNALKTIQEYKRIKNTIEEVNKSNDELLNFYEQIKEITE